jgi:dihydroorotase
MRILIKNCLLIDPEGKHHQRKADVLVEDGKIIKVGIDEKFEHAEVLDVKGSLVMPGAMDLNTFSGEPGFEEKETLERLNQAALQGGFSSICTRSDLFPVVDQAGQVSFLQKSSAHSDIYIRPLGAISKGLKGESLAELYDMHLAGAVAFCDAKNSISNLKLISLAMQYVKSFGGKLLFFADEPTLSKGGQMNEGEVSIHLGMKGIPAIAEEMAVKRILDLALYNQVPVTFFGLSVGRAIDAVRQAKAKGQEVYAGVFVHHIYFNETKLVGFNSNYKLRPPLRSESDRLQLIEAIKDGTIDFLSSDHCPENIENKQVEFDYASTGMIGLESALSASWTVLKQHLSLDQFVALWSVNIRKALHIKVPHIEEGQEAELSIFSPEHVFTFSKHHRKSLSDNTAYYGEVLTGKVLGVVSKGKLSLSAS